MSEDNRAIGLDMMRSQLETIEAGVEQVLQKRGLAARQLREALAANGDALSMTILDSLGTLGRYKGDNLPARLLRWAAEFPADMMSLGLTRVYLTGAEQLRLWDQARAMFGSQISFHFEADPRESITKCVEEPHSVSIFGWLTQPGSTLWWPALNESRYHDLRIIGAWPLRSDDGPQITIIARGPISELVGDTSVLIAHDDHHKAAKVFDDLGLKIQEFGRARSLVLFSTSERLAEDDPRLQTARQAGLDGLRVVGALPAYKKAEPHAHA